MVSFGQVPKKENNCNIELINREYSTAFPTFEDQSNFVKLKDFINRRDNQLKEFKAKVGNGSLLISTKSLKAICDELASALIANGEFKVRAPYEIMQKLVGEIDDKTKMLHKAVNEHTTVRNNGVKPNKIKQDVYTRDTLNTFNKVKAIEFTIDSLKSLIVSNPLDKINISRELAEKLMLICLNENIHPPFQEDNKFYLYTQSANFIINDLRKAKDSDIIACDAVAKKSIDNLEADITEASQQLQMITSSEAQNQDFKKYITLTVAILLGLILVAFFGGVLYKSGNEVKAKLIGESGLQFITIFVIIIAVILFGIMNILKGSELAAILSAIAGYILGKTAPPKSEKTLELELETLKMQEIQAARLKEEELQRNEAERLKKEAEEARLAKEAADKAETERVAADQSSNEKPTDETEDNSDENPTDAPTA